MPISGFTAERITANCGIVYLHMDKERGSEFASRSALWPPYRPVRLIAGGWVESLPAVRLAGVDPLSLPISVAVIAPL